MIRRHPFRRCCAVRLCDDCVYEVVVVESFKIRCLEVEMSLVAQPIQAIPFHPNALTSIH